MGGHKKKKSVDGTHVSGYCIVYCTPHFLHHAIAHHLNMNSFLSTTSDSSRHSTKGMNAIGSSFRSSFFRNVAEDDDGVGHGILSPPSGVRGGGGGGSTTVTPITPMTPMTTPRTPLQILLGRDLRPFRRSSHTRQHQLRSANALHDEEEHREKQLQALQMFANFLNTAETTLADITERENSGHQVLGPGIVRVCNDLADEIEEVASELNKEHARAARRMESVMSGHELMLIEEGEAIGSELTGSSGSESTVEDVEANDALETLKSSDSVVSLQSQVSLQSHEDFINSLSTTHTLLLDMAAALRAVTQKEAQELGEVALEVARMFVWSLGKVHGNMIKMSNSDQKYRVSNDYHIIPPVDGESLIEDTRVRTSSTAGGGTTKRKGVTWGGVDTKSQGPVVVEIFGEEKFMDQPHQANVSSSTESKTEDQLLSPKSSSPGASLLLDGSTGVSSYAVGERVRVLWPPLLPAAIEAGKIFADVSVRHPLPAIAIGLTCGPAAMITTAIAGPPLLVADWAVQTSYDALSEHTPVIEPLEKGAANALQVARLAVLCSRLVVKQSLSVCERQIKRRGGAGKICTDVVGGAVDMALHPVETVGTAIEGLFWMGGAIRDVVGFVKDTVRQEHLHE